MIGRKGTKKPSIPERNIMCIKITNFDFSDERIVLLLFPNRGLSFPGLSFPGLSFPSLSFPGLNFPGLSYPTKCPEN